MLELKNLYFGYNKKNQLFTDLDLSIEQGGIYGLLGKNGAGKTSLLKIIAGLLFPQQGDCTVMGYTPKVRSPAFLADIYFLSEDIYLPATSMADYVKLYAGFYPHFDHNQFTTYINEFKLTDDKLLTNFSHGQKKKFLIAFGLATNCKLLILDEPTNGLDIPSKSEFKKLLASIVTDEKLIIISTHQVHDVESLVDAIIVLDEGKIVFNQSIYDITNKLTFTLLPEEPASSTSFYYEKRLGGFATVTANDLGQDTQADLEILFNAILLNKEKLHQHFQGEKNER